MNAIRSVRFHDGERYVSALAVEGRSKLHILCITDAGVRVLHRDKSESRACSPLLLRGREYPVDRFVRRVKRLARPLTQEAKDFLFKAEGKGL